jgi:hypothetical protein
VKRLTSRAYADPLYLTARAALQEPGLSGHECKVRLAPGQRANFGTQCIAVESSASTRGLM